MKKYITFLGKKAFELLTKISPKISCQILYFSRLKKFANLKEPKTFNEKTTYLKLYKYANDEQVIKCADKYSVRKFIEEKGYGNILNELYGVYNSFNEIDFEKLPNKFVLKCTHGCAYNIICANKSNLSIEKARKKVNKWLKEKYGYATTELHYTKIKPRIIIEKYLCDENDNMPLDYKFYCFNGEVTGCMVCSDRIAGTHNMYLNFYNNNWNELPYFKDYLSNKNGISRPKNLNQMIEIAKNLSKGFPFVRVDLYNDDGKIIFGELTFTPACCCNPKYSKNGDNELGKFIK